MKQSLFFIFTLLQIALAQNGIQISADVGYINFLDQAKSNRETIEYPLSEGGIDVGLQLKSYKSKNFFTGFKGGYSILNADESEFETKLEENSEEFSRIDVEADPTQQLNASFGCGISIPIAQNKFEFETALFGGLGWIRTGDESVDGYDNSDELIEYWNASNSNALSYLINPQMNMNLYLGNILQIKLTGNYYYSNYVYDQKISSSLTTLSTQEINLNFRAFSATAGIALRI